MGDDWLTAGDDEPEPARIAAAGADDWLSAGADMEPTAGTAEGGGKSDDDWLASDSVEFKTAEVLYGSPCGFAVPLGHTYWCEQSRRLISEQCTAKEIDSFLSPDCNQIYGVEQAEMFENKCAAARSRLSRPQPPRPRASPRR